MKFKTKRFLALFMAFAMALSLFVVPVSASSTNLRVANFAFATITTIDAPQGSVVPVRVMVTKSDASDVVTFTHQAPQVGKFLPQLQSPQAETLCGRKFPFPQLPL